MVKIGILGAGSWGLGLAMLLNNNGHEVTVWSVFPDEIKELDETRENKRCLPGVIFPEHIKFNADTEYVVKNSDVLILAVASPYTRSTAKLIAPFVKEGQYIVNVGKGIEEHTLKTLCEVTKDEIPQAVIAVLSGPSHAEEVGRGIPTTCVIGTAKKADAQFLQNVFMSNVFRVYISPDVLGICIGGALKNVIALASGVADGLGYGDNTKAALITRGIAEIARLGTKMGAHMETFYGLKLAYEAGKTGGSLPTVFNAANERAVAMFLNREIGYLQIPEIIAGCMEMHKVIADPTVEEILQTEQETYEYIKNRW